MMWAWLLCLLTALAQDVDVGTGGIPNLPPGPPPVAEQVDARAHAIAVSLRCPVCQGLSVADSTSEAAVMFQRRIHELVAMGYTDDQIRDYFVERYGEWILLDPASGGLNDMLYVLPALLLGVGGLRVFATVVAWRREPDDVPLPSDLDHSQMDEYERRLLEELGE